MVHKNKLFMFLRDSWPLLGNAKLGIQLNHVDFVSPFLDGINDSFSFLIPLVRGRKIIDFHFLISLFWIQEWWFFNFIH